MHRRLLAIVIAAFAAALVAAGPAAATTSHTGSIGGAQYRVEVPDDWNGTLVLYSHGYYPPGFPSFGIGLTNRPPDRSETEAWLLAHGYALAASQFKDGGLGYQIENALSDQIALLDWFDEHVGHPRHTVSYGQSLGGAIAVLLAERNPGRFDGVASVCAEYDPQGVFNAVLDINFVVKTLLAPGEAIELVHVTDPAPSTQALVDAIQRAVVTPQGRARLALAAAMDNLTGWWNAHEPQPTELAEQIRQQALWIQNAYTLALGPSGRVDLEARAGGNPSFNVGIDYGRQLQRSSNSALVRRAYREAGLSLDRDLATLARAPRIAPDPRAVAYMYRYGVPTGRAGVPTVTLHTTGDAGAVPDQERWLAEQMRDPGALRQLWIDRGTHCAINAAEEIVALRTVLERIERGRWPATSPHRLNDAANALGDGYRNVLDFGTFLDLPMAPAFTTFQPPRFMRPSR